MSSRRIRQAPGLASWMPTGSRYTAASPWRTAVARNRRSKYKFNLLWLLAGSLSRPSGRHFQNHSDTGVPSRALSTRRVPNRAVFRIKAATCGPAGPASAPPSGLGGPGRRTPGRSRETRQISTAHPLRRPGSARVPSWARRGHAPCRCHAWARRYGHAPGCRQDEGPFLHLRPAARATAIDQAVCCGRGRQPGNVLVQSSHPQVGATRRMGRDSGNAFCLPRGR